MRLLDYAAASHRTFRTFGLFKLNRCRSVLLILMIMSQTMNVDSQQSDVDSTSQSVDMDSSSPSMLLKLESNAVKGIPEQHRQMEVDEVGCSGCQQEADECHSNPSNECISDEDVEKHVASPLKSEIELPQNEYKSFQCDHKNVAKSDLVESIEEVKTDALGKISSDEISSCVDGVIDEHLRYEDLKTDKENQFTDVEGIKFSLVNKKCSSSDQINQLTTSSEAEKLVFDASSISKTEQTIKSEVDTDIVSVSCSQSPTSSVNEHDLKKQKIEMKVVSDNKNVNDEKYDIESTDGPPQHSLGSDSEDIVIVDKDTDNDVEIVDVEAAEPTVDEILVEDESDDENDDHKLMGFHFNEDEVLVDKNDKPFQFHRYNSRAENQRRYQKLGEKITEYVYHLLETRCKLKRIFIPLDAEDGEDQSFIFVSENAFETPDKLVIFIHGSGVVRAGQWARSLIINDNLKYGTQIPFIEESLKCGYEVMVLNTNLNYLPDGMRIRGSEDPESHALYVWENLVEKKVKAKHIAIIAHSYGGYVTKELVAQKSDEVTNRVFAVAFTDSVHNLSIVDDPTEVIEFFRERARNWVTSSLPLDEPIKNYGLRGFNDAPQFSAGHEKHEWTSWSSFTAIFKFLNEKYESIKEEEEESQLPSSNL